MASGTHSAFDEAKSNRAGQPNSQAGGSDNLSTTSSKLTSRLPRCRDYKPTALRWWYHSSLIICLATLVGLTEYAIQTLLANQQEGLVSPLWSRSIDDHYDDQQSVSDYKEPSYERLARVPSNATSSQAGVFSVNTEDFLALGYSSSALTAPADSVTASPTSLHTLPSTELLLSNGKSTDQSSLVITSTSSTIPGRYPLTSNVFETASQRVVSSGPSMISPNPTTSTSSTSVTSTAYSTDGYLNLGTTTSTLRVQTPNIETGNLGGGFEITGPSSPSSDPPSLTCISGCSLGGDKTTTQYTMSDTSAYLHIGPTTSTTTAVVMPSTDGGYLSLGTTTASMNDMYSPPPSATIPRIISEEPIPTSVQHTETWAPRETVVELSSTDSKGRATAHRIRTTLPGVTTVYQAAETVSPEVHGESMTVIRQTEVWPSSKMTLERTIIDSRGDVTVQTITTEIPAKTDVLETTVMMHPGETLVAVPRIITTTRGGVTRVMQTTFVDSEGRTTTSLYTTVLDAEGVLATRTHFLATSLPPGYTVLTLPTAVQGGHSLHYTHWAQ